MKRESAQSIRGSAAYNLPPASHKSSPKTITLVKPGIRADMTRVIGEKERERSEIETAARREDAERLEQCLF